MPLRRVISNIALVMTAALVWTAPAAGAVLDLCVLGTGDEFTRTTRARLDMSGPISPGTEHQVAASLLRRLLWEGQAQRVTVSVFDQHACSAALGETHEISVTLSEVEIEALRRDDQRGETLTLVRQVVSRTLTKLNVVSRRSVGQETYFTLKVHFATNRKEERKPGGEAQFVADRGQQTTFGSVEVSLQRDPLMASLEASAILRLFFSDDSAERPVVSAPRVASRAEWREQIARGSGGAGGPGVLVFVHGYNMSFDAAAASTAQLAYDLGFPGQVMFFSWPSRGEPLPYVADGTAADLSVAALKDLLSDLGQGGAGPIYLIAHSMGNRVLVPTLAELSREKAKVVDSIARVIMAAPDVDADTFRLRWASDILTPWRSRTTLYASSTDIPLTASQQLNGATRLGQAGAELTRLDGLDTIDATNTRTDFLGHSYFSDSSSVLSDIFHIIRNGLPPEQRFLVRVPDPKGLYWRFRH